MTYSYDGEPEGSRIAMLVAAAVAGAMVVGLAWLGTWWLSSRDSESSQDVLPTREAIQDEPTAEAEATSHLDRCRSVYDAQSAPLQAAAGSLTQWEVHIGAMNKLVVGAITLRQAWQFWDQTRIGASAKLEEFATTRHSFDQRIFRCPAPSGASAADPELATCHRAVAARSRTLHLATVALARWQQHVYHMDMLRNGLMSAQEATRLWLQNWRQGDREVRAYRGAVRGTTGLTC